MKLLVILLSFLCCLPVIAQGNKPFEYPYHKTHFTTSPVLNNHSAEVLDGLNNYDIKYYELNLQVSKLNTEIAGNAIIYSQVQTAMLDTFYIELIDTIETGVTYEVVDSIWVNNLMADYTHENNLLKINLSPSLPSGSYFYVKVFYHGDARATEVTNYNGISNGTVFNSAATYTFSGPYWSNIWFPCKQILYDKADSTRMFLVIDSDCLAGSNGILESVMTLPDDKLMYEWVSHYPIAYYLISFAVGQYVDNETYAQLNNFEDSVLIQSYLFPDNPYLNTELVAIEKTKENMRLFSDLFGQYPFSNEKYGYCLSATPWGAMENQTMTTIGYQALDTAVSIIGNYRYWYSAHELGHSWFGDNVTCATWQDIWVNEGFASYCEYLALQFNVSQAAADEWMSFAHDLIRTIPDGSVFIPEEEINYEDRIFDDRLEYKKGAAILHMIRFKVNNDSLFFKSLRNYETKFAGSTATGLDFKAILDSTTGVDFTDFFNEWYFGEGYPTFNIYYYQQGDTLHFHSVQTTSSPATPLFKIPVELRLDYSGGDTTIKYNQYENIIDFTVVTNHHINQVVFDPNHWLVANGGVHVTSVSENISNTISYNLSQNFPNPFNPVTNIQYSVGNYQLVTLKVYDVLGNEVATLVNEEKPAGNYNIEFNGSNLASGMYLYQLKAMPVGRQAGDYTATKKLILLK